LAKFLGHPVGHQKVDQDEIQSLDFKEIADHKVRGAYEIVQEPVLVEDMGITFNTLNQLPGTFSKWFIDSVGLDGLCKMLDAYNDRGANVQICFAYFDGKNIEFFEGRIDGKIVDHPRGSGGFGFDPIFIPNGSSKTLAEMDELETKKFSVRTTTVFPKIKEFLEGLDK
jgi:non-canonical purine NTP pyrophosphatase (RdgB/HAM1 family)